MESGNIYRLIALVMAVAGIIVWMAWAERNKFRWKIAVAPLSWLINIAAFYVCYLVQWYRHTTNYVFLNNWSLIIRLQSLVLVIGLGIILIINEQRKM